jgi:hypothetical protein
MEQATQTAVRIAMDGNTLSRWLDTESFMEASLPTSLG